MWCRRTPRNKRIKLQIKISCFPGDLDFLLKRKLEPIEFLLATVTRKLEMGAWVHWRVDILWKGFENENQLY